MNRKLILSGLLFFFISKAFAQVERQVDTTINGVVPLIPKDRVELLKNVDMIANMQYGFSNVHNDSENIKSQFAMNQFRLEIKGKVYKKVYFRWRNSFTRPPQPLSVDNVNRSTDLAFIRVDATPEWSFSFGKMYVDWGGYEFDLNPIDIYQYNDLLFNADGFLTGVQATWLGLSHQQFSLQVINSRSKPFVELYGTIPNVSESMFPVAMVGNWNGSFADGKFQTLWSYSIFHEAEHINMHYVALGNQLMLKRLMVQYDFKWNMEDLDRTTVVSTIVPNTIIPHAVENTSYFEHWLRVVYKLHPKWSLAMVLMVNDANWFGNPDPNASKHIRTAWGYNPAIEFFPYKNLNLKFYATYIGRAYNYSSYAKTAFGATNTTTGNIMFGFISPLLVL